MPLMYRLQANSSQPWPCYSTWFIPSTCLTWHVAYLLKGMYVVLLICPREWVAVCKVHCVLIIWEVNCQSEGVVGLLLAAHNVVGTVTNIGATAHPPYALHSSQ